MGEMASAKFKVAVCGGGIGGLTFAITMGRYPNVEVEIYEAMDGLEPFGAGIGIWPRVWKILVSLGIDGLASKASSPPTGKPVQAFAFRKSDQVDGYHFYDMIAGGPFSSFYRADFQKLLIDHLPSATPLHYSKRLQSYSRETSGKIVLEFEDDTTATCDILVGADGVRSVVRKHYLCERADKATAEGRIEEARRIFNEIDPVWTGYVVYRAIISPDGAPEMKAPTQYMGKNAHVVIYPIANGKYINFGAFQKQEHYDPSRPIFDGPWATNVDQKDFLASFSSWEPEIQAWLKCIDQPTSWAMHVSKPLSCSASDGVVLLGDAAHAMSPHQGSGAGQAIEDAYFLATMLGHRLATPESLPEVLRIYDSLRRPFAEDIAHRSNENGRYFGFYHPDFDIDGTAGDRLEQKMRLEEMGAAIGKNWEWVWSTTLDEMILEGFRILEGMKWAHL